MLAIFRLYHYTGVRNGSEITKRNGENMKKLIFATNNQGKVNEIKQILGDGYEVYSLKDLGIHTDIEENGTTFEENAIIKATTICKQTKEMVLADDSGFVVDYLNGEPGIYSARYLGEDTSYDIKNADILKRCKNAKDDERSARFVCAIACAYPDGHVETTEGVIEGILAHEPKGTNGFGYDPIFYLPERGCTTGEMEPEEKNKISHRGIALRKMVEKLEKGQ
jgi:XTP/dITP diphosphohydrolase